MWRWRPDLRHCVGEDQGLANQLRAASPYSQSVVSAAIHQLRGIVVHMYDSSRPEEAKGSQQLHLMPQDMAVEQPQARITSLRSHQARDQTFGHLCICCSNLTGLSRANLLMSNREG